MNKLFQIFIVGISQLALLSADHTCTNLSYYDNELSCDHGCCDSWPYETCCPEDKAWLGWAIAGGVIGGILVFSLVVCLLCAFVKKKGKPGRVIQPNQVNADPLAYQPNVTYISYPQSQVHMTNPQLPPYTPSAPPPPAYQSVYNQEPLPPIPAGLQQHGYHHAS